jgi:Flp pilus assembly pilin Flp
MMRGTKIFRSENRGTTAVEYALVAALLVGMIVVAVPMITGPLRDLFAFAQGALQDAANGF